MIEDPERPVEWLKSGSGKRYRNFPVRAAGKLIYLDKVIVRSSQAADDVRRVNDLLAAAGYGLPDQPPVPEVVASEHAI